MQVVTVGRSEENNIVVSDLRASRVHLQVVKDDNGGYSVVDLGSTNGTYVNGVRISSETRLNDGDELKIGNTVLPWQNYFGGTAAAGSVAGRSATASGVASGGNGQKPKKKLMFIIIAVVVLLVAGGIVFWKIYSDMQEENVQIQQEKEDFKRMTEESEAAYKDFMKKQAEADRLARKAAESQSEEDKAAAAKAKKEAEDAQKLADDKASKAKEYETKMKAAQRERDEAQKRAKEAEDAKNKAEKDAENAVNRIQKQSDEEIARANKKAETAQAELNKLKAKSERKDNFTNLLNQMSDLQVKEVCNKKNYTIKTRENLTRRFESANETEQENIISTMNQVKAEFKPNEIKPQGSTNIDSIGKSTETQQTTNDSGSGTPEK